MTITRTLKVLEDRPAAVIRVAFASSDREVVDQHFGTAAGLVFYDLDFEHSWLVKVVEFESPTVDSEDKLAEKLAMLNDCVAVYCRACGASAVRQLVQQGVQPVKVSSDSRIDELLQHLLEELRGGPGGWLARAMRSHSLPTPGRFDEVDAEGWQE